MALGIDILQARSNKAYIYADRESTGSSQGATTIRVANMKEQREKAYQGRLTKGSRKRLARALHVLSEMSPKRKVYNEVSKRAMYFHLSMITLTLPYTKKALTPKEGNSKLLRPWLRWIVRTKGAKGYVWKCEHQQNGQIHYHVITNIFINHTEIKNKWNNILRKHELLKDFKKRYGHDNPNSTDVHAIRRVKNITAYFISYLKSEKNDKEITEGKIWDCSANIKNVKYFTCVPDEETNRNIRKGIENGSIIKENLDYCIALSFRKKHVKYYLSKNQFQEHQRYYRQFLYIDPLPQRKKKPKPPDPIELKGLLNPVEY